MNLGLTTSFIIAGILMLSILSMNRNIAQSSQELTMQQVTQTHAETISQILEKDITNIGYKQNSTVSSPITEAEQNHIQFKGDIDNDGSVELVEWEFTDTDVNSPNPDDKVLIRRVDSKVTEFKSGVTKFNFTYLDKNRNEIETDLISSLLGGNQSERDKIRFIKIELVVEGKEKIGRPGNASYTKSIWKNQFTPENLRL